MSEFKYMVENEAPNDEGKSRAYLSIPQPDHKKEYWEKFEHHFMASPSWFPIRHS